MSMDLRSLFRRPLNFFGLGSGAPTLAAAAKAAAKSQQEPAPAPAPMRRSSYHRSGYRNGWLAPFGMSAGKRYDRHLCYLAEDGNLRMGRIGKPRKHWAALLVPIGYC